MLNSCYPILADYWPIYFCCILIRFYINPRSTKGFLTFSYAFWEKKANYTSVLKYRAPFAILH